MFPLQYERQELHPWRVYIKEDDPLHCKKSVKIRGDFVELGGCDRISRGPCFGCSWHILCGGGYGNADVYCESFIDPEDDILESPRDEISGVRRPCSVDECSYLIDRESSDFGCCEKLVKIGDIEARRSCCECSSDKFRPELCVRIGGRDDPRSYGDIICGECRSNGDSGDLLREFVSEDVWDLVMSLKLTAIREKWPAICGHDPRDLLEDIS